MSEKSEREGCKNVAVDLKGLREDPCTDDYAQDICYDKNARDRMSNVRREEEREKVGPRRQGPLIYWWALA